MSRGKLYFILLHVVFIQNAFGYLDPGTWNYVLQILLAVFVGGIYAIKVSWQNIKNFFNNLFKK